MKDFSYHDHDPHEVDYDALKQENDLPFPEPDPKDFEGIDYLIAIKDKAERFDDALNILREVMTWIENWEPEFTDEPEWEVLEKRVKNLLKGK